VILLDTCVVSEVAKSAPDPAVAAWFEAVPEHELRLSVLTLGEIKKGASLLEPGPRRDRVEAWLDGLVRTFADRLLPVEQEVAFQWGVICAEGQRSGRRRPPIDALLAATAVRHQLVLATRNTSDFEGTGATLVNPWNFLAK
jgi:predicted nucleic acid-binding protein